jgi:hypothetical protein
MVTIRKVGGNRQAVTDAINALATSVTTGIIAASGTASALSFNTGPGTVAVGSITALTGLVGATLNTTGLATVAALSSPGTVATGSITSSGSVQATTLKLTSVPVANPNVAGAVWSDAGVLKLSAG